MAHQAHSDSDDTEYSDSDDTEYSGSDDTEYSSDKELQKAFKKGDLKPGLNVEVQKKRKRINNKAGLQQSLLELKRDLPWVERLDITCWPAPDPDALLEQGNTMSQRKAGGDNDVEKENEAEADEKGEEVDVENDFKREMYFLRQAQAAVLDGLPRLHALGVPTKRPEDYFAEMEKSDHHMHKIRAKLMSKQVAKERSEKAKQLRQLRKYGKKVQVEVLQQRQKEKKAMIEAVKKYRKGAVDKLDFLDELRNEDKGGKKKQGKFQNKKQGPSAKRSFKNAKFGFGGKKRGKKENTKESAADVSNMRPHGARSKGGKGGKAGKTGKVGKAGRPNKPRKAGKVKRPGKASRQKMKNKKK
uniref:probable rRNA-processing protein EBP2 n=1 Tax=Myxine glutinosa TaxID=7769 RepID=UPI00358EE73D